MRHRRRVDLLVLSMLSLLAVTSCDRREESADPETRLCLADLAAAGARFEPWAGAGGQSCKVVGPISIQSTRLLPDKPIQTSCAMGLAWVRFETEVTALARSLLGQEPKQLLHYGSYACRRMTGNSSRMSEHATGRALDIAGFTFADGRQITILRDWRDQGPAGKFLRAVAAAACRRFSLVLTPDSDRNHQDHLHLDIGPWKRCG